MKQIDRVSVLRFDFFIFLCLTVFFYFKYNRRYFILLLISFFSLIIFIKLVIYHRCLIEKNEKNELFILINNTGLKRISNKFNDFEDDGKEYLSDNHEFAQDLDIFGPNSLFQCINTTVTKGGRERLKDILLLKDEINKDLIYERQEAVKELGEKGELRQNLFVEGKYRGNKDIDVNEFIFWLRDNSKYNNIRIIIAVIFIIVTAICGFLCIIGVLPESFILLNLAVNFIAMKVLNRGMEYEMQILSRIKYSMETFSRILTLIDKEEFKCDYLRKLTQKIRDKSASKEIKDLFKILDWIGDSQGNAYYLILNIILFLDVFLMKNIYKWKEKNKEYVEEWIKVISEIDALSSIANIPFDNEDYAYPHIDENITVDGKNIGHPLIGHRCIKNNFSLKDNEKVALITGSNMSGKSTFLRTIGINLLLAYIGAPVCAEEFSCKIMKIYTCMRTKDNLEESISSFYAEILRIKQLINDCKNNNNVFFLLDEIFKGTNSADRYTGAEMLIKQLIKYGGIGFVSTHDFQLCHMEEEKQEIVNYNFREYYEDNKIKFDYKIRRGPSTTRNAIHLMKLAGIEFE